MTDSIAKVFFNNGFIGIETAMGDTRTLPLEVFPALYYADDKQRIDFHLWDGNHCIRWDTLDEDIHISHFYEEEKVNYDNEVNCLLAKFPYLDIKALADVIGIHWTLLARMKFGVVSASGEMLNRIKSGLHAIGKELLQVS